MTSKIIVLAGATATGKTQTAVAVAKRVGGEIISADSMQIYQQMDIGTAKPTMAERQGIPHYCIDEVHPNESFSVARFKKRADEWITHIQSKNKIPILAGGTGFYINAVLYGNDFTQTDADESIRNKYYALAEEKGNAYVYDLLTAIDKDYATQVHCNNIKRVVRALEYYEKTGELFSVHNQKERSRPMARAANIFILNMPRDILYKRLDARVDKMIANGLAAEVHTLLANGVRADSTAMNGIGYKELLPYIKGEATLSSCIELIKQNTRHYAKRQITWFKNQLNGQWLDISEMDFDIESAADKICMQHENNLINPIA